ncbi:MAG: hypothetical protein KGJ36_02165 [Acidobacteriota bacterium]|nr:hypothetical protein [Acidobacteriota bacterium]
MGAGPGDDPRLDPRVRRFLAAQPAAAGGDVASRDELLAHASSPEGRTLLARDLAAFAAS